MAKWQPIETAPIQPFQKDQWYMEHSPYLLLWNGGSIFIGNYNYTEKGRGKWHSNGRICAPTHWMPLPKPPAPSQSDRGAE